MRNEDILDKATIDNFSHRDLQLIPSPYPVVFKFTQKTTTWVHKPVGSIFG